MHELLLVVSNGGHDKDLVLTVDDDVPAAMLLTALADAIGERDRSFTARVGHSDVRIDPGEPLGTYELRSGDQLVIEPYDGPWPNLGTRQDDAFPWSLRIVAGPRNGSVILLPEGTSTIGRGTGERQIDLRDAAVSRVHAELNMGSDLEIRDLGSRNGTFVNDREVVGPTISLHHGDRIEVGDTILVVEAPKIVVAALPNDHGRHEVDGNRIRVDHKEVGGAPHLTYAAGRLRFNRPPRVVTAPPRRTVAIGPAPDTPPKRRLPIAAAVVPVVMGLVILIVVKNALFLLFMAAGPAMAIWSYVDDRRSGRNDFHKKSADYRAGLVQIDQQLSSAQREAIAWRHAQHPTPPRVTALAVGQSSALWSRRPEDEDFLTLRAGLADQSSLLTVTVDGRGDKDLIASAWEVASEFRVDPQVPVALSLRELRVIGLAGAPSATAPLARWMCAQLAAHHSERDVAIAVLAPARAAEWNWTKWLPHLARFGEGSRTVAADEAESLALFAALRSLIEQRAERAESAIASGSTTFSPHVVVFIEPPIAVTPREMAWFLETAPRFGVSIVWVDTSRISLPGTVRAIVEPRVDGSTAQVTFTDGGIALDRVAVDRLDHVSAERLARALAPLRDAAGGSGGEDLPDQVDLVDLFDPPPTSVDAVAARWQLEQPGLSAIVGVVSDGPLRLDLNHDGPHGLVAGTTGAGKSELLQTLVASMAIEHPPSRLNFVLVDYKGGAAFKDFRDLPHTVGFVTDLDPHLATRALTSLNAEIRRREAILATHGAKDLPDLLARLPAAAPPSLLIVIDEFAALRDEVPDFVDGVVDIGRRGRSLGVHMLLATQKPGGVITPAIQANTNLRIALRVADRNESGDVLGRGDAADIPRSRPGRALVKTGPSEIRPFQAAYVGGLARSGAVVPELDPATTFHFSRAERRPLTWAAERSTSTRTDLQQIVESVTGAAVATGEPAPHRPWLPELPLVLPWGQLGIEGSPDHDRSLTVSIGLADRPSAQLQERHDLDLADVGHLIVYGTSGSGKTTLLRTIAASLAASRRTEDLHLYGLDFAGRGLASLNVLPHCGDVVTGDEVDRVRRLIAMLGDVAGARKVEFGAVGAASLAEYRRVTGQDVPYVVLLLDGFASFWSVMEPLDRSQHIETFTRVVGEGRGVGVHVVVTADRRGAVPPLLASTIAGRAVLRMANPDEYLNLGLSELAKSPPLPTGRAFIGDVEVQVAVMSDDAEDLGGGAQAAGLGALAQRLTHRWSPSTAEPVRLLPDMLSRHELTEPSPGAGQAVIGVEEGRLDAVTIDLHENPAFLVTGPDRSGRTTTLDVISDSLARAHPDMSCYFLGTRRNPLATAARWTDHAVGTEDCTQLAVKLGVLLDERASADPTDRLLIVIDDGDDLTDGAAVAALDRIVKRARDANAIVVVAMSSFRAQRTFTNWVQLLRNFRHGLLLQPDLEDDGDILHTKLPKRAGLALPPGRGYLVRRGTPVLIQVAT